MAKKENSKNRDHSTMLQSPYYDRGQEKKKITVSYIPKVNSLGVGFFVSLQTTLIFTATKPLPSTHPQARKSIPHPLPQKALLTMNSLKLFLPEQAGGSHGVFLATTSVLLEPTAANYTTAEITSYNLFFPLKSKIPFSKLKKREKS